MTTDAEVVIPSNPGRIPNPPDPRDGKWSMRGELPPRTQTRAFRRPRASWRYGFDPLAQGNTGTCVGHGGEGYILCEPVVRKRPGESPTAFELYDRATELDGIPDNDHDRQFGTTVRALMLTLREKGFIDAWRNGQNVDDILDWLDLKGPVIVGVDWFPGMFRPDSDGFVELTGEPDGGHCFLLVGYDLGAPRPHVVCLNSWGKGWGQAGYFKIAVPDMERLLFQRNGDSAVAAELDPALPPPQPTPPIPPQPEEPHVPEVFKYPFQEVVTLEQARAAGLPALADSNGELLYLLAMTSDRNGTRIAWAKPLYQAKNEGLLEDGTLDNPTLTFFVQRIQAHHRADWNATA